MTRAPSPTPLDLDRHFQRVPKPRTPRAKSSNWRVLADGTPSSDGIHADIAGLARLIFGFAGQTNTDGVFWISLETRARRSTAGGNINQQRGCIAGFPEIVILYRSRAYTGEVKRPQTMILGTRRHRAEEQLLASQEAMHPHIERAGVPVAVWRSREEFYASVVAWELPHKKLRF